MRKTSWFVVAGFLAMAAFLGGCTNGSDATSASATTTAPATKNLVIVTWRPVDKTSEFLSAWRAKE
ncbi:hypothetical protein [Variovorax sp. Sphag1AA]|uniref:hypothetical protein n=1 Tax=Variovorax sp. Sphag1AA TaxID=2587027 RepID=UPI00161EBE4D|nr:hypothetical protein [Variovorax sp. Sphag1AA]MBB3179748.1 hypothetical protein [Variovorax sp. Sphag1AA]